MTGLSPGALAAALTRIASEACVTPETIAAADFVRACAAIAGIEHALAAAEAQDAADLRRQLHEAARLLDSALYMGSTNGPGDRRVSDQRTAIAAIIAALSKAADTTAP